MVIVNGSAEMLELLETVLDAGHYDVVFVEIDSSTPTPKSRRSPAESRHPVRSNMGRPFTGSMCSRC